MTNPELLSEALQHLEAAVRLSPDHPRYRRTLGEAYLAAGDPAGAARQLRLSLDQDADPRARYQLALANLQLGRLEDVEKVVQEALDRGEEVPRARYVRALARFRRHDYDGAVVDVQSTLDWTSNEAFYALEAARILVAIAPTRPRDRRAELVALAYATLVDLQVDAETADERLYLLACCELERGEAAAALDTIRRTIHPDPAEVALRRGIARALLGDRPAARSDLHMAKSRTELSGAVEPWLAALDGEQGTWPPIPPASVRVAGLAPRTTRSLLPFVLRSPFRGDRPLPRSREEYILPIEVQDVDAAEFEIDDTGDPT